MLFDMLDPIKVARAVLGKTFDPSCEADGGGSEIHAEMQLEICKSERQEFFVAALMLRCTVPAQRDAENRGVDAAEVGPFLRSKRHCRDESLIGFRYQVSAAARFARKCADRHGNGEHHNRCVFPRPEELRRFGCSITHPRSAVSGRCTEHDMVGMDGSCFVVGRHVHGAPRRRWFDRFDPSGSEDCCAS